MDFEQNLVLKIEVSIAMSITFTREKTFSSSSLRIFDGRCDILAKFCYKVLISKTVSIFASRYLGSGGLSIISTIYLERID